MGTPAASVFTPPASCQTQWTYEASVFNSIPNGLLMQHVIGENQDPSCFPPGFAGDGRLKNARYISPGWCPVGYNTPSVHSDSGTTSAVCCPDNFSYFKTLSSIVNGPTNIFEYAGCVSQFPKGQTTSVLARSGNSGLNSTAVAGPLIMWAQAINVQYQSTDLSLFVTSTSSAVSSTISSTAVVGPIPTTLASVTSTTSSVTVTSSSATSNPVDSLLASAFGTANSGAFLPSSLLSVASQSASDSSSSSSSSNSLFLSPGAIAGIVIGSVALIAIATVAVVALCLFRRRKTDIVHTDHSSISELVSVQRSDFSDYHELPSTGRPEQAWQNYQDWPSIMSEKRKTELHEMPGERPMPIELPSPAVKLGKPKHKLSR